MNLVLPCFVIALGCIGASEGRVGTVGKVYDGDILMTDIEVKKMQNQIQKTGGTSIKIWEGGIVPYEISQEFDEAKKKDFLKAMDEISTGTCIKFVPRKPHMKDFIFARPGNQCSSKVGRVGGQQDLLMNESCMRYGTIVHELIHGLGFYHEQSRPDRNEYIRIDQENVKPESRHNFDTFDNPFSRTYEVPYDYSSIMHYSPFAFQKKSGLRTIIPKVPDAAIGLRYSMSFFDRYKINIMYDCEDSKKK